MTNSHRDAIIAVVQCRIHVALPHLERARQGLGRNREAQRREEALLPHARGIQFDSLLFRLHLILLFRAFHQKRIHLGQVERLVHYIRVAATKCHREILGRKCVHPPFVNLFEMIL